MLDLSRAIIEELSNGNSELSQLRRRYLPKQCSIVADTRERHCPPVKQWGISILPRSFEDDNRPFISISNTEFFQLLDRDPQMWNTSFEQFQFSVRPIEEQHKIGSAYLDKDELVFRDTYFRARHFPCSEEGRLLEILGFHNFPEGLDDVLSRAEFIFLFDNPFLKCLSELGANNMEVMAGCWIESCVNMESVFNVEKVEDTAKMEILWISYAIRLESIYGGNMQYEGFRNLKCRYLDCCPKLPFIFSSSQLAENLEILHIKFCDTMERLFEPNSNECMVPKLRELQLLELQKLESIGCELPSLQILKVGECPMLLNVLSVHQLPTKLKILKIKCCDKLKTLFEQKFEQKTVADATLPNLRILHLWKLPELMTYGAKFPSQLQHPIVKLCPKLEKEH